jgi:hypothetical protein
MVTGKAIDVATEQMDTEEIQTDASPLVKEDCAYDSKAGVITINMQLLTKALGASDKSLPKIKFE